MTDENFERIKEGKGKLNEQDVLSFLGRPDRYMMQNEGVLEMVWEDVNRIRVVLEKGKEKYLWADFSERHRSQEVSLDRFRKLRRSMTVEQLESILGPKYDRFVGPRYVYGNVDPIHDLAVPEGVTLCVWQDWRRLSVQFTDGKVSGYAWAR